MASADRLAALAAELRSTLPVLDRIDRFHDEFHRRPHASRQSIENAIKRYYFAFDYDWERLELVRSKYLGCRGHVRAALEAYVSYVDTGAHR